MSDATNTQPARQPAFHASSESAGRAPARGDVKMPCHPDSNCSPRCRGRQDRPAPAFVLLRCPRCGFTTGRPSTTRTLCLDCMAQGVHQELLPAGQVPEEQPERQARDRRELGAWRSYRE